MEAALTWRRLSSTVKGADTPVGGWWETEVIELNSQAMKQMPADKSLEIIPDATHLFEEPGTLEEVAKLSADWFLRYLRKSEITALFLFGFWLFEHFEKCIVFRHVCRIEETEQLKPLPKELSCKLFP